MPNNYLDEKKSKIIQKEVATKTIVEVDVSEFNETVEQINKRLETAEVNQSAQREQLRKMDSPDNVRKVEVTNPLALPEVQKTEITNPQAMKPEPINWHPLLEAMSKMGQGQAEVTAILEKLLGKDVTFPAFPTQLNVSNLPTGEANNPKKTDPSKYVNVRLTDGEKFYRALEYAMTGGGGGGGDKVSPATITELLNLSVPATNPGVEIAFAGEVIAFEVQCRTAVDIYFSDSSDFTKYLTIKAGTTKAFTLRRQNKLYLKSASGTVVAEVLGVR